MDFAQNAERLDMRRKIIAGTLSFMMLFAFLFSVVFISVEADHDCEGEHCEICQCIDMCLTVLKTTGIAAVTFFALSVFERQKEMICHLENIMCHKTPTDLKIQLNN